MNTNKGLFVLLAGANGAGKSTIRERKIMEMVTHYANPDKDPFLDPSKPVLCQEVINKGQQWRINNPKSFTARCGRENLKAWFADDQMRMEGLGTESNLVTTSTDSSRFDIAKSYGMRTELHFIGVPLAKAIEREKQRRNTSGAQPPIELKRIKENYRKGLINIQDHIDNNNIDLVMIYDNSRNPGEEEVVYHREIDKILLLNPEPILEWFKDAQEVNPEIIIKIPTFLDNP
jgi:predicted ABC-type ATPase